MVDIFYDSYNILTKVYSEKAFIKQAMNDTQIDEKNRSQITKICYGVLDKDITLSYYISCLCEKNPKLPVRTIMKIAMYNIKFLDRAPYAVVDNAVELLKKLGKGGMGGFLNAILRKFISAEIPLPKDKIKMLSIKYSYPEFAVKLLIGEYGEKKAENIMNADTERTCVRFNLGVNGEKYLIDNRWNYEKTPFDNTFFVNGFKKNEDFDKGLLTFQSIGSVAVCDAVSGGNSLLDACAAPGGKSVNLCDKFGEVTSFELYEHRTKLITAYKMRMNKTNITEICKDASLYDKNYNNKFDAVLCDTPCSGFGVIKDNPDIKLNREEKSIGELNAIQLNILNTCSKYVKEGGALYYSTCSVFQLENSRIIKKFLSANKNFEEVKIESKLSNAPMEYGLQFLPDLSFGAGFYICKLIKKEGN